MHYYARSPSLPISDFLSVQQYNNMATRNLAWWKIQFVTFSFVIYSVKININNNNNNKRLYRQWRLVYSLQRMRMGNVKLCHSP